MFIFFCQLKNNERSEVIVSFGVKSAQFCRLVLHRSIPFKKNHSRTIMNSKNVIFIDSRVADYQSLVSALSQETDWYVLNSEQSGIEQINDILAHYTNLDSIQIFSHGSAGSILIGSTTLSNDNISTYASQLTRLGSRLSETGDILLYGCDVAQGERGQTFIESLAHYTGSDVAASTDLTGNTAFGGDWTLEATTGAIEIPHVMAADYATVLLASGLTVTPNTQIRFGRSAGEWANEGAFAVIKADGSVVTWGNSSYGSDSSGVASQINGVDNSKDVVQIFSTTRAFAALRADGSVVTWGGDSVDDYSSGGDSSAVASALNGMDNSKDVAQIFSNGFGAFAALRVDGSVVTWGNKNFGGDSSAVASALNGVDNSKDVVQVFSTWSAFAALRADGLVVTWGNSSYGGDSSAVASALNGMDNSKDVVRIFSTYYAFAALRADG